jgi:lipoprotein-releasing system permease protein
MPLTLRLAIRFLLSKYSDQFLSFISIVSVSGVVLGVIALVVTTSVINGFEFELSRLVSGMYGDVNLYSRGSSVANPDEIVSRIEKIIPETQAVSYSLGTELMVAGPTTVSGALLDGFDPKSLSKATLIPRQVFQGHIPQGMGEVAIGYALAEKIGARLGDRIRLILPFAQQEGERRPGEQPMGAPKSVEVQIVGIMKMGMYRYDSKFVFTPIAFAQDFLGAKNQATSFRIRVKPDSNLRDVSARLNDHFAYPFRAKSWMQLNENLYSAVELEKKVIAIILAAIICVAGFNVLSSLMMMIHDKTKEISILKAMGFKNIQAWKLFTLIAFGIGFVGSTLGVGIGIIVNHFLRNTSLLKLPPDIYYMSQWPILEKWIEVLSIALFTLLICFLASLYPAFKIAKMSPMKGLRWTE